MKRTHWIMLLALSLALGLALVMTAPAFADDAPPPEQPTAPEAAAPAPPEGGGGENEGEDGGEAQAPAQALGAPPPLETAGGAPGILGPPWAYYYVGATLEAFNHPQDCVDNILLTGVLPSDRKLYLQNGTFLGDLEIDGTAGGGILNQLKGLYGNSRYPAADPLPTGYNNEDASEIVGNISVHHTIKGFTLQGVSTWVGSIELHKNTGTMTLKDVSVLETGFTHYMRIYDHYGAINLDGVRVIGGNADCLDNTDSPSASVTVANSVFTNKINGMGLNLLTNGSATLDGVNASGNSFYGVWIEARKGITIRDGHFSDNGAGGYGAYLKNLGTDKVTLDYVWALNNGKDGVHIETEGDISLTQVAADGNGEFGIQVGVYDPAANGGRHLSGKDLSASDNGQTGIHLRLSGNAAVNGVYANNNGWAGMAVHNAGTITLSGVSSSNNHGGSGLDLTNTYAPTPKAVTVNDKYGHNDVHDNDSDEGTGVHILTEGAVTLSGLDSHDNYRIGVLIHGPIDNAGAVNLADVSAWGNDEGVWIFSTDSITWKGGGASGNTNDGARLHNRYAPSAKAVTVERAGFYDNNRTGLEILSNGSVTLKNVSADGNGDDGAYINNCWDTDICKGNVSVQGSKDWWNDYSGNGDSGLDILSRGAVSLAFLSVNYNGQAIDIDGSGVVVDNDGAPTPKAVTISNIDARNNSEYGLLVLTNGAITVTNISASDNGWQGAALQSQVSGAVKVLRTAHWHNDFSNNGHADGSDGLTIEAAGPVTLGRLVAEGNAWGGVSINNCNPAGGDTCLGKWGVTLLMSSGWSYEFNYNGGRGLNITSGGAVKMSNISARGNGWDGAFIQTQYLNANGPVTIGSVGNYTNRFSYNGGFDEVGSGMYIFASGAVSLSSFEAIENYSHGIWIKNNGMGNPWLPALPGLKPAAVTLSNGQANNNSNGDGISVFSLGNIKLSDVEAGNNDVWSAGLGESMTVPEKLVDWRWDSGDEYYFESPGSFELHIAAQFNANLDLYVDNGSGYVYHSGAGGPMEFTLPFNITAGTDLKVVVTGVDGDNHGNYRLSLNDGPDYVNYDFDTGASGLWLVNDYPGATGTVTVTGGKIRQSVNASNNGSSGVHVTSTKAITLSDVYANDNGGRGLTADNCLYDAGTCSYTAPITLKGSGNGFYNNQLDGMFIDSDTTVSLTHADGYGSQHGHGAMIFAGNLTISATNKYWTNVFDNNAFNGLCIYATGNVTLKQVSASGNADQGAMIDNRGAPSAKAVSITDGRFSDNQGDWLDTAGLEIGSLGAVTLKGVDASNNWSGGAFVSTNGAITVERSSFHGNMAGSGFDCDLWDGIYAETPGNLTWKSSSASGNSGGDGAELHVGGKVTVLDSYGVNGFFGNKDTGLLIANPSSVSAKGVCSGFNGFNGLGIETDTGGTISVANAVFENNVMAGVYILNADSGEIKMTAITAVRNSLGSIGNMPAVSIFTERGKVSILKSRVNHNGDHGIRVVLEGGTIQPDLSGTSYAGNNIDFLNGADNTDNDDVQIVP